jgi:(heptosyl)LPS beta-1,4-glucosyltransferase
MMKISSVTLAKDEEKNISRCILSLQNVADEIIIVLDAKTQDKTESIVQTFPHVILLKTEWQGYSKSKQTGLDRTTNDWVLWIDADEEVTPDLADELKELKKNDELPHAAYSVPRRAFFLGKWIKHSGWYPGRVVRLFDKRKVNFVNKAVHEHLDAGDNVGLLKGNLNHFTDPNLEHYYTKFNNYTSLAAQDLAKDARKFSIADIILRPVFLFIKMYIMRRGFLDGIQGFILAVSSAHYVFTKYAKLWELTRKE